MLVQILFLPNLHHPQIVQSKLVAFFFPTSKISRETTGTPRPLAVYINLPPRGFVSAPPVSSCHSDDPSPVLKGQSPKTGGNERQRSNGDLKRNGFKRKKMGENTRGVSTKKLDGLGVKKNIKKRLHETTVYLRFING